MDLYEKSSHFVEIINIHCTHFFGVSLLDGIFFFGCHRRRKGKRYCITSL